MTSTMMSSISTLAAVPDQRPSLTRFSLVRTLLAVAAVCIPVALVLIVAANISDKSLRLHWPPLLAALLGLGGYLLYVRRIERRQATELALAGWGREALTGAALGTLLFLVALGLIAAAGNYHVSGIGSWQAVAKSVTEMLFVATVEEVLFRAVLFRIPERSIGTWPALILSSAIFALAHLPNHDITVLALATTALAGVLFTGAYLVTRRLWLPIGLHFAWNFVSSGVLSLPTSGNPARGLLQGSLSGPEWLTGGAYGVEGSLVTLVLFAGASALLLRRAAGAGHLLSRAAVRGVQA